MNESPDTVELGCAHFSLLRNELQLVLPYGPRLVDSGEAIARRIIWLLEYQAASSSCFQTKFSFLYTDE